MNLLQLRTQLSVLNIRWNDLPHISNFNQFEYISSNHLDLNKYRIIGYITPKHKIYYIKNKSEALLYILSDNKLNLYISFGFSNPTLWHPIDMNNNIDDMIESLKQIINTYDVSNNTSYQKTNDVLIGNMFNLNINLNSIQNDLLRSNLVEYFMWGSKHDQYPYNRKEVINATNKEKIQIITYSLQQNNDELSITCRTIWSKSIIKIIQTNQYIQLQIKYNPINNPLIEHINSEYEKQYPNDMPTDLAISLIDYPFKLK